MLRSKDGTTTLDLKTGNLIITNINFKKGD